MTRSSIAWLAVGIIGVAGLSCAQRKADNRGHAVHLRWKASAGAEFYNVYRSTTQGQRGDKIGTSKEPVFEDAPLPGGVVFYYRVTAISHGNESGLSNEAKAIIPP